ncbi:MAG: metal-sensing transcriptional repressor [Candidatus Gracilibacteria bacterium]
MRKNTLTQRFNILKGQMEALTKLVGEKNSCQKVVTQFHALNAGLKKIMELYLKENLASCFKSINSKEKKDIDFILGEIIKIK